MRYYQKGYYVRIKKSSGEGFANDCEGFLTVNTDDTINYSPAVWQHADVRRYNALKFTSGGVVSVDVSRNKKQEKAQGHEEAIMTVNDTGLGISPEIFPRFFQVL